MPDEFFGLLNLDTAGLETTAAEVEAGDFASASAEFLAYMRGRTNVNFYRGWDKRKLVEGYDTTEADKILSGHLVHQDLGEDIDWHGNPVEDSEWTYCLNRHEFLTTLGRAYWYTGDEKYTRGFIKLVSDWIDKNPLWDLDMMLEADKEESRSYFMKEAVWRPIEVGIRLYTAWCPCYWHFKYSPLFTPEFNIKMLRSMVDHARFSRRYYTRHVNYFNVSPNWGLMESNGLAHMGVLFPEFKEAHDWKNTAYSRFEEQVRSQVLDDGVHVERCTGYHLVCTFCILQIAELGLLNGVRISDTWMSKLEQMIDFVLGMFKPHGAYPMLSDGDESDVAGERASYGLWEDINNLNMLEDSNDLRYVLKAGARLFGREDMLYAATGGREGKKPEHLSAEFADGGFYVSRDGWENDDFYMAINCGLIGVPDQRGVHGHADTLSVDVSAFGKNMIIDPGRYMYEGPWRMWFERTSSHNTVCVDGEDSSHMLDGWLCDTWAEATCNKWVTGEWFDYFDGSHDGYERLDDPVTHRRRVLFVKGEYWIVIDDITGEGEHELEQFFHFTEDASVSIDEKSKAVVVNYGDGVKLDIVPCDEVAGVDSMKGSEEPKRGWVSYDYGVKIAAADLRYYKKSKTPARFTTIIRPFNGERHAIKADWVGDNVLKIEYDGMVDMLMLGGGKKDDYGKFEFDGELLFVRQTDEEIEKCFTVDSSLLKYDGKVLLDNVIRVKKDSFEK